jgi:hypothetical protein
MCANAPTSIVSCNNLGFLKPFDGSHLRHVFSKVPICYYNGSRFRYFNTRIALPFEKE